MRTRKRRPPPERFEEKVDRSAGPDGCHLWTACLNEAGYGRFNPGGRVQPVKAHRWAYIQAHGPIPDGLEVCHSCDTPACVNVRHLWLGTHRQNMQDMAAKGRASTLVMRGADCGAAKLTDADVLEIRRLWAERAANQHQIAAKFGVTNTNVSMIVRGQTWRHLLPDALASERAA